MVVAECKRHNREEDQKTFTMNAWYYGNESIGGSALTVCRVCLKESDEKKKQKQEAKKKNITINPRPRSVPSYSIATHRTELPIDIAAFLQVVLFENHYIIYILISRVS